MTNLVRRWILAPLLACFALGCGRIDYQPHGRDGAVGDAEIAPDAGLDAAGLDAAGLDAAGLDAGGLDGDVDGGADAGPPDGGFDPTRPLVADCSHRWIETTDIDSNFKVFATDEAVIVAGYGGPSPRVDAHRALDGSIGWTRDRSGPFAGGAAARYAVLQETGGGAATYAVVDLVDGSTFASFQYVYGTFGWGGDSIGVRDDGSSLIGMITTPTDTSGAPVAEWSVSVSGVSGALTGPGPATILARHAPSGAYELHEQVANDTRTFDILALPDGRWSFAVQSGSTAMTFGSHVLPPATTELVTLNDDLSFDSALPLAAIVSDAALVPGTTTRVLRDGAGVAAYDDAGQRWRRADCAGLLATSNGRVHVLGSIAGTTFCGAMLPPAASGVVLATLDATTGETVAARWLDTTVGASSLAIARDGDAYVVYRYAGEAGLSLCSEPLPATGRATRAILAL